MSARDQTHIERIQYELQFIQKALKSMDKDAFLKDEIMQHAISMSLISIGECARCLSEAFKEKHSQMKWVQIVAVRNIAAHGYWQLNMEQIWQAIEEDIPELDHFFASL
ncbi:MAG: DUF86 domain-containing protein [Clostridia bacterium]|nr:DUF86 domain-containing protein [Clostridia bacterium]